MVTEVRVSVSRKGLGYREKKAKRILTTATALNSYKRGQNVCAIII